MRDKSATPPPDVVVARLAARQHGVLSTLQLRRAGIGANAIAHRARTGRLHRRYRGVYAVGHTRLTREGEWLAAVLACGEGALLSHGHAGVLWNLVAGASGPPHVTVPAPSGRRPRKDIMVHRSRLVAEVRATRSEIPVTTPARTLIDIATDLRTRELERAVDEAERRRLASTAELHDAVSRHHGHRGAAVLASLLERHAAGSTLTRRELEERFLALCRAGDLPQPRVNERLDVYEVDFLWRDARLVAETDGWDTHRTRRAFEEDRRRDARLAVLGYLVMRFTWRQVVSEPKVVAGQIRTLLRSRRRVP